jgi:hypothetical protein
LEKWDAYLASHFSSEVVETNLMEHDQKDPSAQLAIHGNQVGFVVDPFSINTVSIDYKGQGDSFWQTQK